MKSSVPNWTSSLSTIFGKTFADYTISALDSARLFWSNYRIEHYCHRVKHCFYESISSPSPAEVNPILLRFVVSEIRTNLQLIVPTFKHLTKSTLFPHSHPYQIGNGRSGRIAERTFVSTESVAGNGNLFFSCFDEEGTDVSWRVSVTTERVRDAFIGLTLMAVSTTTWGYQESHEVCTGD